MPSRKPQTFHFAPYNLPAPFPTPEKPLFLIFPPISLLHQTLLGAFPVQGPRSRPPRTPSPAEKGAKRRPGLRLSLRAARKSPPPRPGSPRATLRASCAVCGAPARPRRSTAGLGGGTEAAPSIPRRFPRTRLSPVPGRRGATPGGWRERGRALRGAQGMVERWPPGMVPRGNGAGCRVRYITFLPTGTWVVYICPWELGFLHRLG